LWLGKELPRWRDPCQVRLDPKPAGSGGSTTFNFGLYVTQTMTLTGPLSGALNDVAPHEVTHTILANHFKRVVARWFDEGASVMSESFAEQQSRQRNCLTALNEGKALKLTSLFKLRDYPEDLGVFYAQSYSVTNFLVEKIGRPKVLEMVELGMRGDWELAVQEVGFRDVEDVEKKWIESLRDSRKKRAAISER
jgi:hypothetical protein